MLTHVLSNGICTLRGMDLRQSNEAVATKPQGGEVVLIAPSPKQNDTAIITAKPESGQLVDKVIIRDKAGKQLPVTKQSDGTFTCQQPAGDVTIEVIFVPTVIFTDLKEKAFYLDAVQWAVANGITSGIQSILYERTDRYIPPPCFGINQSIFPS